MNRVLWILNGCGLEGGSVTGGPVRFHEISSRWLGRAEQLLMTTTGGERLCRSLGSEVADVPVRASLFLRREPVRAFRFWSYVVTALLWRRRAAAFRAFLGRGGKARIVTVSDYFCDIVPARALRRATGAKWTAWIHHRELPPSQRPGNRAVNALTWRMQEWSFRQIARHADAAWLYDTDAGDLARERLIAFGMDPGRIHRMRCGIDLASVSAAPEPAAKAVDAVMVGVRPNKGLHDILPVWERVLAKRPSSTLLLAGGMSGEGELLDEIRRRGLDGTIRVARREGGPLPAAAYHALLKTARTMFAPSHEEGWGIAVCEAMAAGLPVIAYDLPVYRRIYGDALKRVPCFDQGAFAEALVEVLDSPAEFAALRAGGIARAAGFGWDGIAAADFERLFTPTQAHQETAT